MYRCLCFVNNIYVILLETHLSDVLVRPRPGVQQKFSSKGLVSMDALGDKLRHPETAQALSLKTNFGLSSNTWATYQTTINHLDTCSKDTGADISLPFNVSKTLEFVGWMEARGLKSRTMSAYLSGLRMYHISLGYDEPSLRVPIVKLILKGQDNWDRVQAKLKGKEGRLPVTINMMKLLKNELRKAEWPVPEK